VSRWGRPSLTAPSQIRTSASTHTALIEDECRSKRLSGIGMQNAGERNPPIQQRSIRKTRHTCRKPDLVSKSVRFLRFILQRHGRSASVPGIRTHLPVRNTKWRWRGYDLGGHGMDYAGRMRANGLKCLDDIVVRDFGRFASALFCVQ